MCLEAEGRIAFLPREESMWAQAKQLTEYGVCEETASEELAALPSLCWKRAGVSGRQLQPRPGPCRRPRAGPSHSAPAWSVGRKRLQGNSGRHAWLRAVGKGKDKVIFLPASNGKEMSFFLHKLDFLQLEKNILLPCCMMLAWADRGQVGLAALMGQRPSRWPAWAPGLHVQAGENWLHCSFPNKVVFISYSPERLQNIIGIAASHIINVIPPISLSKSNSQRGLCSLHIQSQLLQ